MNAYKILNKLTANSDHSTTNVQELKNKCFNAIEDDLNSPILISILFDASRYVNSIYDGKEKINIEDLDLLKSLFKSCIEDILGLNPENAENENSQVLKNVVDFVLSIRLEEKQNKNFALSDKIRIGLSDAGIEIKDRKDGFDWSVK